MKTTLQTYATKTLGKNLDVDGMYGAQCVDQAKHYAKEVIGISLGSFGGSAKDGWANKANTFSSSDWERIPNNPKDKDQVPEVGDIIFWTTGTYSKYGHVGVVYEVFKGQNKLLVLNQNSGNGDGQGKDDAVRIQEYTYKDIAGWYNPKRSMVEYEGLPVFIKPQPAEAPKRRGAYVHKGKYIVLYPHFFNSPKEEQKAVLEHEYAHYIYFSFFSKKDIENWEKISNFDIEVQKELAKVGKVYKENAYVSEHAKKFPSEDFGECWEFYTLDKNKKYGDYRDEKISACLRLMQKYDPRFK